MTGNSRKKILFLSLTFIFSFSVNSFGAPLSFRGNKLTPVEIKPSNSTGLNAVYVLNNVEGVSVSYEAQENTVEWYKYSNLGGGYAEQIKDLVIDDKEFTLSKLEGDMGYLIKDGLKEYNFWIINYKGKEFEVESLDLAEDNDCAATALNFKGNASPLIYYTITGRQETVSREISIQYNNLEWDEDSYQYNEIDQEKILGSIENKIIISPPIYCKTSFLLSGDQFQKKWNQEKKLETAEFSPISVEVKTFANHNGFEDNKDNQISGQTEGLGGSAPYEISFESYVTDAVIHNEWQMSEDENFENVNYRINQRDFDYTFTEEGTVYIRFIGSNADGSCEAFGDVYKVEIGSSELMIPNAFSPDGDGINDEWKVAYRSLLTFKCWIFNKHGQQVYYFEDPSLGWDGKRNGKYIKSGVYYYVIEATGSDGKKYKRSGDINIITSRKYDTGPSSPDDEIIE